MTSNEGSVFYTVDSNPLAIMSRNLQLPYGGQVTTVSWLRPCFSKDPKHAISLPPAIPSGYIDLVLKKEFMHTYIR